MRRFLSPGYTGILVVAIVACGGGSSGDDDGADDDGGDSGDAGTDAPTLSGAPVGRVDITPEDDVIIGARAQMSATTFDSTGDLLPGRALTWQSSDPSVATVDAMSGVLTGLAMGTVQITATSEGVSDSMPLTVLNDQIAPGSIATGSSYSCGITRAGVAYCWGAHALHGAGEPATTPSLEQRNHTPVKVRGGHTFVAITAGTTHTVALTATGEGYAWGYNNQGQLGIGVSGTQVPYVYEPMAVVGGHRFTAIDAYGANTIAITSDGTAYTWGINNLGRLGNNTTMDSTSPVAVATSLRFVKIEAGLGAMLALTQAGDAYAWGAVQRLGGGSGQDAHTPVLVPGGRRYREISLGGHALAIATTGETYGWGGGAAVGYGGDTTVSTPRLVLGGHLFQSVTAGLSTSAGILADGTVYTWGENNVGQLGDGTMTRRNVPGSAAPGLRLRSIVIGPLHMVALDESGAAYGWGSNGNGQLGVLSGVSDSFANPTPSDTAGFRLTPSPDGALEIEQGAAGARLVTLARSRGRFTIDGTTPLTEAMAFAFQEQMGTTGATGTVVPPVLAADQTAALVRVQVAPGSTLGGYHHVIRGTAGSATVEDEMTILVTPGTGSVDTVHCIDMDACLALVGNDPGDRDALHAQCDLEGATFADGVCPPTSGPTCANATITSNGVTVTVDIQWAYDICTRPDSNTDTLGTCMSLGGMPGDISRHCTASGT